MKLSTLLTLAIVTGISTAAYAECVTSTCPADEQPTAQQATELTLERRIEYALTDLEIFNAYAFTPDNLRATELTRKRMIENALNRPTPNGITPSAD